MDATAQALLAYAAGLLVAYLVFRWFRRPFVYLVSVLWRGLIGGAAVWALDAVGAAVGVHVALNPATALVAGFLGVPGLAALVALSL